MKLLIIYSASEEVKSFPIVLHMKPTDDPLHLFVEWARENPNIEVPKDAADQAIADELLPLTYKVQDLEITFYSPKDICGEIDADGKGVDRYIPADISGHETLWRISPNKLFISMSDYSYVLESETPITANEIEGWPEDVDGD